MIGQVGRNVLPFQSGDGLSIINGASNEYLPVGATIDMSLVPTAQADTILPGGQKVFAGQKYFRLGQVLARITNAAAQVLTLSGSTFTVSVTANGSTQTTPSLPNTATATQVQQAVWALPNVGPFNISVSGPVGGPYNFTGPGVAAPATVAATGGSFAAGPGGNPRFFGPYDPNATDGRAVLARGDCGLVINNVVFGGSLGLPLQGDEYHLGLLTGGRVWRRRLLQCEAGTPSLAAGPTMAALLAAMPTIFPVLKGQ